jgi:hypothetical protein
MQEIRAMKVRSARTEFHPYQKDGKQSSGRDSSVLKPAGIVPGGGDTFSSRAPSSSFRGQQLGSRILTIHVKDEPGVEYQIKEADQGALKTLYKKDPQTDALVSTDYYAQKGAGDEWTKIKRPQKTSDAGAKVETPVKAPGDPASYFIQEPKNTTSVQEVYIKKDGVLKDVKQGFYDGNGGVKLVDGLNGGTDAAKDARNHRIIRAKTRLAEAQRALANAQPDIARVNQRVTELATAKTTAALKDEKARADYLEARRKYVELRDSRGEADPKTMAAKLAQVEAGRAAVSAQTSAKDAKSAHAEAVKMANNLGPRLQREVTLAERELNAAENSSS